MLISIGEAQYLYDIPDLPNQLHAAFVLAKARPHSTIVKIDDSAALVSKFNISKSKQCNICVCVREEARWSGGILFE